MITGASQADVALITAPAYGDFTAAIDKENNKADEIQWQTRQHSRPINLLGVKHQEYDHGCFAGRRRNDHGFS